MTTDVASLNAASAGADQARLAEDLHPSYRQLGLRRGMQSRLACHFIRSVTALLGALAGALFLSNIAEGSLLQPHDPLIGIRMSAFFWVLGMLALAVALACVYMRPSRLKLGLVLWFATTLVIYRLGLQWQGIQSLHGYIGSLARTFGLPVGLAITLLNLLFSYLLVGSAGLLLWDCLAGPEEVELKANCVHCGGHIAFSSRNLGRKISCPHCSKETTLHKPGLRKMSCYFCKGHIEFPAHAIGEKFHCPHCKMDITLKEPA